MNDCPNAEMRDLLPDLLHDRLDAVVRATVEAHVAACVDCQAELILLQQLRVAMSRTVRVDVARIAAAIPAARPSVPMGRSRHTWVDWRIAAAVTLLLAGGTSVMTFVGGDTPSALPGANRAAVTSAGPDGSTSGMGGDSRVDGASTRVAVVATGPAELSMGGGLSDLSASELEALLGEIDDLDALPAIEPDVQVVPLAAPEEES